MRKSMVFLFIVLSFLITVSLQAAVFTVTNNSSGTGIGSIRWALNQAEASAGSDTIIFDSDMTIQLVGGARIIFFDDSGLTVDANGHEVIIDGTLMTGDPGWPIVGIWISDSRYAGGWGRLAKDVTIKGLTFQNCAYGGGLVSSGASDITLQDCIFRNNGSNGLKIDGTDRSFDGAQELTDINVINCEAYSNEENGFLVTMCSGVTLENCNAYNNTNAGIWLISGASNNTVRSCEVNNNNWPGIILSGDCNDNLLDSLRVSRNAAEGIKIDDSSRSNTIRSARIFENTYSGILITGSSKNNEVRSSYIWANQQAGLWIANNASNTRVTGNNIGVTEGNQLQGNQWAGVIVADGAVNNFIGGGSEAEGNLIAGNEGEGVKVDGPSTVHNLVRFNTYYENQQGGYLNFDGANEGLAVPLIDSPDTYSSAGVHTVSGQSMPGTKVDIYVSDSETDTTQARYFMGTAITDDTGNFSLDCNYQYPGKKITAVAHDDNNNSSGFKVGISDTVYQKSGVLLYSENGQPVAGARVELLNVDGSLKSYSITANDGSFAFYGYSGQARIRVIKEGCLFPPRNSANLSAAAKGEIFNFSPAADMTIYIERKYPLALKLSLSKETLSPGDIFSLQLDIENKSKADLGSAILEINLPAGVSMLSNSETNSGSSSSLSLAQSLADSSISLTNSENASKDSETILFDLSQLSAEGSLTLSQLFRVSPGISSGQKSLSVRIYRMKGAKSLNLSPLKIRHFNIQTDSFMENSTIIGKVFTDTNRNNIQDMDEKGIAGAVIVTEEGIIIQTDKNGLFSVPDLSTGRHLFYLRKSSLPAKAVSAKTSVIVDVREGSMHKVNFPVYSDSAEGLTKQDEIFTAREILNIPDSYLKIYAEKVGSSIISDKQGEKTIRFFMESNSFSYIKDIAFIIVDKQTGKEIFRKESTDTLINQIDWVLPSSLFLNRNQRELYAIAEGHDSEGNIFKTAPFVFTVSSNFVRGSNLLSAEFSGFLNNEKAVALNTPKEGAIQAFISARAKEKYQVIILDSAEKELARHYVETDLSGKATLDMLVPFGFYKVILEDDIDDGVASVLSQQEVNINSSWFFLTALADAEVGHNEVSGNIELAGDADTFDKEIYHNNRTALYLKGKIKGKYLLTLSYDSERDTETLFNYVDPDAYYPVYGDDSSVDYTARETSDKLFVKLEWDRSVIQVGSFNVTFNENSLLYYSRSMHGFKADFVSRKNTAAGDPLQRIMFFGSSPESSSYFNRFSSTGGSVYYLEKREIIPGTDKVVIETRDRESGRVINEQEMVNGIDYAIDYDKGRLIFSEPVSMVRKSSFLTSSSISSGDPVYIAVSFEYKNDSSSSLEQGGLRVEKNFGALQVGAALIKDEVSKEKMGEIKSFDIKAAINKYTNLKLEYARTENISKTTADSDNGGLTFTEQGLTDQQSGEAYSVELSLIVPAVFTGNVFYRNLKSGFTNQKNQHEEGIEKTGLEFTYSPADNLTLYSEALTEQVNDNYISRHGFSDKDTIRLGTRFNLNDKIDLEAEWQSIDEELNNLDNNDDLAALGIVYNLNDKSSIFLKNQWSSGDRDLDFFEGGLSFSFTDLINLSLSHALGDSGDYTRAAASVDLGKGREFYISSDNNSYGANSSFTTGFSRNYDANTSYFTEYSFDDYGDSHYALTTTGFRKRLNEKSFLTFSYERNYLDDSDQAKDAASAVYSFTIPDTILFSTKLELRDDESFNDLSGVYTENRIKWSLDNGLTLFAKADYSLIEGDNNFKDTYFKEFSFGSAFRPFNSDRINILAKYSYFNDKSYEVSSTDFSAKEKAEIFSLEGIFDVSRALELYFKYAAKESVYGGFDSGIDDFENDVALYILRASLYFSTMYGSSLEYRFKDFSSLDDEKEGICTEIFFQPADNLRLTLGYNFTDFTSSLNPGDEYDSEGVYLRLTGTAAFDGFEFLSPFRKEWRDWRLFKEPFARDIKISGSLDLSVALIGSDLEWNYSNMNRFEKNYQYLYAIDKENTFNEAVYNKAELDIDIPVSDNLSFTAGLRIDPHALTKSKEVTLTSASGDSVSTRLLYFGGDDTTVPVSLRSEKGNALIIPANEVSGNKVKAQEISTSWGDVFYLPETELAESFLPFDSLSLNYQKEKNYLKLSLLGMQDIVYSSDDPLKLSGRCDFWQPNPWLFAWQPHEYYYGDMQAFKKGRLDDSLVYYNRNSRNEFLTMLRGVQVVSDIPDFGRIEGSIASPVDRWDIYDEYDEINNFTAAFRYKNSLNFYGRDVQTGATFTSRYGYSGSETDFMNNVAAFDFYTKDIFGADLTFEYASSKTETDKTALIRKDYKGNAFLISLDKNIFIAGSENILSLSYTEMEENFFTAASDYRYTSLDQYWSRHLTFYEPSKRVQDQAMPFRTGDGIRENRKVFSFKAESVKDEVLKNNFSVLYIEKESDSSFLECRFRDELLYQINDAFSLKMMALHYHLPETEAGIDPWLGVLTVADDFMPGAEQKLYKNEAIKAGEDPSISTFSTGFKWKLSSWMDFIAIYERSNNWGDMFPQLVTEDTSFGNTEDTGDYIIDSPVSFLYGQDNYEQPDYSFFNIYRLKSCFYPAEPFKIELSWTKNDNKFAAGIDDNINHFFAELSYLSSDNKLFGRINYTRSKTYDVAELIENNNLSYDSHDNFFAEIRYQLSEKSAIYANYGVFAGMYDDPVSPYTVVPWALPALDTRSIFKIAYTKKF